MAWVRYDDNFHDHDKIAHVRVECVEALSLHLLANTWTSRTGRPGFVPTSVPTVLVGGRSKASKWVGVLVSAGLWTAVEDGWEFVNHERYRASEKRQTPGTPDDLSAIRAAAGAKGGTAKAANDAASASKPLANDAANVASVWQTSSKPCSPEPEPGTSSSNPSSAAPPRSAAVDELFETWWTIYPRRERKAAARKAFAKAIKLAEPSAILAGAVRLRDDPNRVPMYTPHPASWLNAGGWDDEPLPSRQTGHLRAVAGDPKNLNKEW